MRRAIVALLLAALPVAADGGRPKIGLALGGGGARGAAHVGVLEWFEANQIPIDYLAGTSMGGLVGGLYCSGMTTAEMRALVEQLDWDLLIGDEVPYGDMAFRRKEDLQAYPSGLEMGLRGGLRLPIGLIEGHAFGLLLSRLTVNAGPVTDFDELPIPFRCVATDMERAEEVILRDGSLAAAIRATMSIPGVLSPVELNGRILADGGLLNNVPTDVVRAMGADIVIAVDVGNKPADREALNSLTALVGQSVSVMILQNVRDRLRLADIVLAPELGEYGTFSFAAVDAIADLGYQHAEQKRVLLDGLRVDDATWQAYLAERDSRRAGEPFVPSFIDVEGGRDTPTEAIDHRLSRFSGLPFDAGTFESELDELYGLGLYSRLEYSPVDRQGARGLLVRVTEKRHGPPFLHAGLELSGRNFDTPQFGVRSRVTAMGLSGFGSEWRTELALGPEQRLSTEYLQPIGGPWSLAPYAYLSRTTSDLFTGERRVAEYRVDDVGAGVDLVAGLGRRDELRVGAMWSRYNSDVRVGAPVLPSVNETVAALTLRARHEGLDNPIIPTRGTRAELRGLWALTPLGSDNYRTQLSGSVQTFVPVSDPGVLQLGLHGATSFDQTPPPHAQFTLGGLLRLSAYEPERFRGSHYLLGRIGYLHRVSRLPQLVGGGVYLGGWYELGGAFGRLDNARYVSSLSVGAAAETLLGPAFLGFSLGEGGANAVHFTLGSLF